MDKTRDKTGFPKIVEACRLAKEKDLDYAWIDTCCIDKSSTAELTESINFMCKWYQQSSICIVYIDDWLPGFDWADIRPLSRSESRSENMPLEPVFINPYTNASKTSKTDTLRWFTRGWTLQELIVPAKIDFYDRNWDLKGHKSNEQVAQALARITGIACHILTDDHDGALREFSLGQRMSWASYRTTSRAEDMAYCLLGIFEINMPLLYGEGEKAFLRLQDEIIRSSTDLSLFAWQGFPHDERRIRGIYAYHPIEFAHLGNCCIDNIYGVEPEEFSMTNNGMKINTSLLAFPDSAYFDGEIVNGDDLAVMPLKCTSSYLPVGVLLQQVSVDIYMRVTAHKSIEITDNMSTCEASTIYICRDLDVVANDLFIRLSSAGIKTLLHDPQASAFSKSCHGQLVCIIA